jgi:hypothetical protein
MGVLILFSVLSFLFAAIGFLTWLLGQVNLTNGYKDEWPKCSWIWAVFICAIETTWILIQQGLLS